MRVRLYRTQAITASFIFASAYLFQRNFLPQITCIHFTFLKSWGLSWLFPPSHCDSTPPWDQLSLILSSGSDQIASTQQSLDQHCLTYIHSTKHNDTLWRHHEVFGRARSRKSLNIYKHPDHMLACQSCVHCLGNQRMKSRPVGLSTLEGVLVFIQWLRLQCLLTNVTFNQPLPTFQREYVKLTCLKFFDMKTTLAFYARYFEICRGQYCSSSFSTGIVLAMFQLLLRTFVLKSLILPLPPLPPVLPDGILPRKPALTQYQSLCIRFLKRFD